MRILQTLLCMLISAICTQVLLLLLYPYLCSYFAGEIQDQAQSARNADILSISTVITLFVGLGLGYLLTFFRFRRLDQHS